ncbi:YigZ family protein [Vagococcus intermedius]|uniref:YigZ family protein n=1 Tax=Vagococcus intermedius TaxID=2991418 RepID=A0AAF0CW51_9ENTE|nr:YigZ family protein [Vagococcus intermedius]WEG74125.1 YigZ family protein [Vagococcus intermedius]WEG76205.1 YigZ family protein [Vagococcus intermedius]
MLTRYLTVKEDGTHETEIKKSRFICTLFRIKTETEAKEIIQAIKKEHWKASHNCHAYVLGDNSDCQRSSDDGEPSGTAGIPMLEILKKRELINTLAVVTRYFGGTELGKGGLIRAYGGAVNEALDSIGIVEGKLQQEIMLTVDYAQHSKVENFLANSSYDLKATEFTDKVILTCMIDENKLSAFETDITELLNGQQELSLGEKSYFEKDYLG